MTQVLCVEWVSTKTRWHINLHYAKNFCTHIRCEVKDMRMEHLWLKDLNGWDNYGKY